MATPVTQYNLEGMARFEDNEQVDFRKSSEGLIAEKDILREREIKEAGELALQSYATSGIQDTEQYLASQTSISSPRERYEEHAVHYIRGASRNLTEARQYLIDTNWNLEKDTRPRRQVARTFFTKTLSLLTGTDYTDSQALSMPKRGFLSGISERELLNAESAIGKTLFGDIPAGVSREFFNLDANTWIWHQESAQDGSATTTRYEVQETGILKAQDGAQYSYLEGEELQNLTRAVEVYYGQVMPRVYKRDPQTGQKLTS